MDTPRLAVRLLFVLFVLGGWVGAGGCGTAADTFVLGATTSTYDSGLLEHLIARFNENHPGLRVRTVIAGSGEALALGRTGDVDLLLVHAPEAEARFVEAGHAPERNPVLVNGYVIAGPPSDPAGIRGATSPSDAFAALARGEHGFVSRGDSSGTHYREIALWREAGVADVAAGGAWYVESGQGQATTLHVASERGAYVLTDGATFALLSEVLDLDALVEGHPSLRNIYSLLAPRAALRPERAAVFADWLRSGNGRRAIGEFRVGGGAEALFAPWPRDDAGN